MEEERVTALELRKGLRDIIERVRYEDIAIVVTNYGKDMAVMISMDSYKTFELTMKYREKAE